MSPRRNSVLLLLAAVLACEPPDEPAPGPSGGSGGDTGGGGNTGGDGGGNGGGGGGAADDTSTLTFVFDRRGALEHVSNVDLELVGVSLFVGTDPRYVNADTPCDAGGAGTFVDLVKTVPLDLRSAGETPFTAIDLKGSGQLREAWLVLKQGTAQREGRAYKVHAGALCTLPGHQYTLIRLRPGEPVSLGGADHRILVTFDASSAIAVQRLDCSGRGGGDGGGGGGGGGGDDAGGDDRGREECSGADDPDDDGRGDTRLRLSFATSLPVRAEPAQ